MSYYDHLDSEKTKPGPPTPQRVSIVHRLRRSYLVLWLAVTVLLLSVETALQGHAADPCSPRPSDQTDMQTLADWIKSLQYADPSLSSFGAIKIHRDVGYYDSSGTPYYRVGPYNSSLAVVGLLRAPIAAKLTVAEGWIQWVLNHAGTGNAPPGVVHDHWYRADGSGETTCPAGMDPAWCDHSDSLGSYAATTLGVAWDYYTSGGSLAFLNEPGNKKRFEEIAAVILGLQEADGLVSEDRSPVKYLMDNSEVYWGLRAMENLEAHVFGDKTASLAYSRAASRVQDAIRYSLLNPDTGLYRVAKLGEGAFMEADLDTWYPGVVSLLWPHLYAVTQGNAKVARLQIGALNTSWDGTSHPDWSYEIVDPGGFLWPSIGYAALLAGDCGRARAQADMIKAAKYPTWPTYGRFGWPFPVDDAGWLLSTLSQIGQPNRSY